MRRGGPTSKLNQSRRQNVTDRHVAAVKLNWRIHGLDSCTECSSVQNYCLGAGGCHHGFWYHVARGFDEKASRMEDGQAKSKERTILNIWRHGYERCEVLFRHQPKLFNLQ